MAMGGSGGVCEEDGAGEEEMGMGTDSSGGSSVDSRRTEEDYVTAFAFLVLPDSRDTQLSPSLTRLCTNTTLWLRSQLLVQVVWWI